jgi:hypothetical protein
MAGPLGSANRDRQPARRRSGRGSQSAPECHRIAKNMPAASARQDQSLLGFAELLFIAASSIRSIPAFQRNTPLACLCDETGALTLHQDRQEAQNQADTKDNQDGDQQWVAL